MCALCGSLLADQDGIYDPADPNDRLLLGLKGTLSEAEQVTLRNRLERGRRNKAARGEMFYGVPMGYVQLPSGEVTLDADEQVREAVRLIFEKFDELGTAWATYHYLLDRGIQVELRPRRGPRRGQLIWQRPNRGNVERLLHHPSMPVFIHMGAISMSVFHREVRPGQLAVGCRWPRCRS